MFLALSLFACSEQGLVAFDVDDTPAPTTHDTHDGAPTAPDPDEGTDDPPTDDPSTSDDSGDDPDDDPAPPTDPTPPPATPPATPPPPVSADCWSEPLDPTADVSDLRAQFLGSNARSLMEQVLERRFPSCADLLVETAGDPYIDIFLDSSSWQNAMDSLGTICHEQTHGYDYEHALNPSYFSYWLTASEIPQTDWIDALPRSVIWADVEGSSTDLYKDLYLTGTQGTYGFTELLDETACYLNSLGGVLAGADDGFTWGVSGRDGVVAFLYYIELYLQRLESDDPATYAQLQADPEVKDLLRDLWLRGHFLLEAADADPRLGINDGAIRQLLYRSDNQGALEDFLGYPLAASSCLP